MGSGFQKLIYCAPFLSPILQFFYDDTLKNLTNTHTHTDTHARTSIHPFFVLCCCVLYVFSLSLSLSSCRTSIHSAPWPHHLLSSSRNDLIRSFGLSLPAVPIWWSLRNSNSVLLFFVCSAFPTRQRPSSTRHRRLRARNKNKRKTRRWERSSWNLI